MSGPLAPARTPRPEDDARSTIYEFEGERFENRLFGRSLGERQVSHLSSGVG